MDNKNSEFLAEMLDIHFCENSLGNKVEIVNILATGEFLNEEINLENFVNLYSQILSNKSVVEISYNNGLTGCLLRGKYGSEEVLVQIKFN